MLNPHDIENKVFTVVRLREGYAQSEVDDFLDEVILAMRQLVAERDGYRSACEDMPTQVLQTVEPELSQASKVIKVAERVAEETVAEARQQCDKLTEEAKAVAQRIIDEGTRERHAIIGEMEERKRKLQERLDELARVHADVLRRMQSACKMLEE